MLHVRLISPPEQTPALVAALGATGGTRNLVVQSAVAVEPPGDHVQFDVFIDTANTVFSLLRHRGFDENGSITVDRTDAVVVRPDDVSHVRESRNHETEPVWEMVEAGIRTTAAYPLTFYALLTIAGLLAAVGILTNSQILIVGAMVVGPEYAAIIGTALALTERDGAEVRRGMTALSLGFLVAIAATLVFSLVIRFTVQEPAAYRMGIRPVADLIDRPNVYSIIVAVLAGIVGVVSMTESRASTLIGVFISVTTIPAAADIALAIAFGDWRQAWGATEQLLLNIVVLIVVGVIVLTAQRWVWRWRRRGAPARAGSVT